MKKIPAILMAFFWVSSPGFAQQGVLTPAPPPANPAAIMPTAAAPKASSSPVSNVFPMLPPSRPCKPGDLWGFYRLEKLYEQPAGKETTDFQVTSMQYLHFAADSTYRPLKLSTKLKGRKEFYNKFTRKQGDPVLQYVVHPDAGFVYFYNEGTIVDTQACFIVANDSGQFKRGRLLLMPPAPQEGQEMTTRLLRVYHNFNRPRGRPPHAGAAKP